MEEAWEETPGGSRGRTDVGGQLPGGVRAERGDLQDRIAVGLHGGPGDRAQPVVSHVVQLGQLIAWKGKEVTKDHRIYSGQALRWRLPRSPPGLAHGRGCTRRWARVLMARREARVTEQSQASAPEAGHAVRPRCLDFCGEPAGRSPTLCHLLAQPGPTATVKTQVAHWDAPGFRANAATTEVGVT